MARVYVTQEQIKDQLITVTGQDAKHVTAVLRCVVGDSLEVICEGLVYETEIVAIEKGALSAKIVAIPDIQVEQPIEIYLLQGLPKGDKLEWIIQKSVELGVYQILPIAMERSVSLLTAEKGKKKRDRWQAIAMEAGKQCRRNRIPEVVVPQKLEQALQSLPAGCKILTPWEEEAAKGIGAFLQGKPSAVAIIIGPEGGISEKEIDLIRSYGGETVTMGPRILRTETAAIAALTMVGYAWGDLHGEKVGEHGTADK
ncbi:MAG: 16S rRNA (uracil(1498)-N(3))-methyltransferase [Peptococcaceae bacterium]|jgi:16S rRNA (uracil1498-N3)-methyltransferase|nr:16S rRNA (uracil(1498)-N(3))-methyltransferase [Peptococcaceae bacterium]